MTSQERQWYLARDGQQYGPFSDADLAKYHAAGQLGPTDFLWHEALPNWRSALVLFPPRRDGPIPSPPTRDQRRPAPGLARDRTGGGQGAVWRRRAIIALIALLSSALVGAGNGYVYRHWLLERSLFDWGRWSLQAAHSCARTPGSQVHFSVSAGFLFAGLDRHSWHAVDRTALRISPAIWCAIKGLLGTPDDDDRPTLTNKKGGAPGRENRRSRHCQPL